MRRILVAAVLLAAAGGPVRAEGARAPTAEIPASGGPFLYVANQAAASVSVIDMSTDSVVRTVDLTQLGFTDNARPHHVAVEPDGSAWYVSLIGDGYVLKLSPEGELLGRAPFETPGMLALDPDGEELWVGRSMMAVSPPQRIGRIDRSDMTIEEMDVLFDRPHALALSPDGRYVYVASLAGNDIAVIDPAEERIELMKVPGPTHVFVQFAVSPDGSRLVTGGEMSGRLLVFGLEDPMHPRLQTEIEVRPMPWHPVFSPDGSWLYVGNQAGNSVTVVDATRWTVDAIIEHPSFAEPHGSAVSPDGRKLYISSRNVKDSAAGATGRVTVIDTGHRDVVATIDVGRYAAGMGTATRLP